MKKAVRSFSAVVIGLICLGVNVLAGGSDALFTLKNRFETDMQRFKYQATAESGKLDIDDQLDEDTKIFSSKSTIFDVPIVIIDRFYRRELEGNKVGKCRMFARHFKHNCDQLGINCYNVITEGDDGTPHVFNLWFDPVEKIWRFADLATAAIAFERMEKQGESINDAREKRDFERQRESRNSYILETCFWMPFAEFVSKNATRWCGYEPHYVSNRTTLRDIGVYKPIQSLPEPTFPETIKKSFPEARFWAV